MKLGHLRWLVVGLKLIQLEQKKKRRKIKINTLLGLKRYMEIFLLKTNNLLIQILAAKMT